MLISSVNDYKVLSGGASPTGLESTRMANAFLMHMMGGATELDGIEFNTVKVQASNTKSSPIRINPPASGYYYFCAMQYNGSITLKQITENPYGNQYCDISACPKNANQADAFDVFSTSFTEPGQNKTVTLTKSALPNYYQYSIDSSNYIQIWHEIDLDDYTIVNMDVTVIYWWFPR